MKNPDDEVILTDGTAFFVKEKEYKQHLSLALETKQVSRSVISVEMVRQK
jgi:hypothetical protein